MALSVEVLDRSTLDINCTPDKRTVLVEHLSNMTDQIRTLLNQLFESSSNVYVNSNKRPQETTENTDLPIPPMKQMRIDRFAKKTVGETFHSHHYPRLSFFASHNHQIFLF